MGLLFDGNNDDSIESPVPSGVSAPTLLDPHRLAAAEKFLADVKAADPGGEYMYRQLVILMRDYWERGLHPGLSTRAKELFEGHPDLLVTFNTILPEVGQCTVPE